MVSKDELEGHDPALEEQAVQESEPEPALSFVEKIEPAEQTNVKQPKPAVGKKQ